MSLTIAIPSYQRPTLLARTLRSLLAQNWRSPLEIVVCINQPDDGYDETLAPFSERPELRLIRQTRHTSGGEQLFAVLAQARHDFVIGLCDDDELDAAVVEDYLDAMRQCPWASALYAPIQYINRANNKVFTYNHVPEVRQIGRGDFSGLLDYLASTNHWPELGLYRRDAIRRALIPGEYSFYEFNKLAHLLTHGEIIFACRAFYHFIVTHADEPERINFGSTLVMQPAYLERVRGGLDLLVDRALLQPDLNVNENTWLRLTEAARKIYITRLVECFHNLCNTNRYADALELAARLRAQLVRPDDRIAGLDHLAVVELARRILAGRSWLEELVLYRQAELARIHAVMKRHVTTIDSADEASTWRGRALFLCAEADRPTLARVVGEEDIITIEDLTEHLLPGSRSAGSPEA